MYARVLSAEEKRNITQMHKAIEKPGFKLSDKVKQKLIGVVAIGISIASPLLLDGDATISVIMLPLGLYLLFTKEKVVY